LGSRPSPKPAERHTMKYTVTRVYSASFDRSHLCDEITMNGQTLGGVARDGSQWEAWRNTGALLGSHVEHFPTRAEAVAYVLAH
jgi:hypothetical protein